MLDHKWTPRRVVSNVTNSRRLLFLGNFIVRRQNLIFVLCATGFASVSPNGVGTWEALAEPVAPQLLSLTMHQVSFFSTGFTEKRLAATTITQAPHRVLWHGPACCIRKPEILSEHKLSVLFALRDLKRVQHPRPAAMQAHVASPL